VKVIEGRLFSMLHGSSELSGSKTSVVRLSGNYAGKTFRNRCAFESGTTI